MNFEVKALRDRNKDLKLRFISGTGNETCDMIYMSKEENNGLL